MHRHTRIITLLSLLVIVALVACINTALTSTKPQPTATVKPQAAGQPSPTVLPTAAPSATVQPTVGASPAAANLLDVSSDGHTAAVLVGTDQIELLDVVTGQPLRSIKPSRQPLSALFAPDGKTLAVTLEDIAVDLWDVPSGNLLRTLSGFESAAPVYGVQWSRDGRTLIWISRATVQLMDVTTGQLGTRFSYEEFVRLGCEVCG
jgi:WD40 repeat protein